MPHSSSHGAFTVDEHDRLYELGIFPESETEIIGGNIVPRSPAGKRRSSVVPWLSTTLLQRVRSRALARVHRGPGGEG